MEEVPIIESELEVDNPIQISIVLNKAKYTLKVDSQKDIITFELIDVEKIPRINYIRKMNFKEIKEMSQLFNLLKTSNDFYDYLKFLSKDKKINIKKSKGKISLILFINVLSKQQEIIIDLFPEKNELEINRKEKELNNNFQNIRKEKNNINNSFNYLLNIILIILISLFIMMFQESKENKSLIKKLENQIKEINDKNENQINELNEKIEKQLKIENNDLKNKIDEITIKVNNNELKNEINNLKVDNNQMKLKVEEYYKEINILKESLDKLIFKFKNSIMNYDEKDMLYKEIENKMNKKIKGINKLYQATKDGGDPINFHLKCDNIPNTLVLIKSEGNRRFGGFTLIPWKSEERYVYKQDSENKTFVFSLDNKKIYYLKSIKENAIYHNKDSGPCFGEGRDIAIDRNPLKENTLYTYQESYDYKGDSNALSEYKSQNFLKALEYEVFQVIFY